MVFVAHFPPQVRAALLDPVCAGSPVTSASREARVA
jgi:hypothetical protein